MVAAVNISAPPDIQIVEPGIELTVLDLQETLSELPADEVHAILQAVLRALKQPANPDAPSPVVAQLLGSRSYTLAEAAELEVEVLTRSFEHRRKLLADALTTPQVARILGTSRQTPHDRAKSSTLLAVMDRGALRFPIWQFDASGPDNVIAGLPEVLRALEVSPMEKLSWLVRSNQMLDGNTPLEIIKAGDVDRIVRLARAVGFN